MIETELKDIVSTYLVKTTTTSKVSETRGEQSEIENIFPQHYPTIFILEMFRDQQEPQIIKLEKIKLVPKLQAEMFLEIDTWIAPKIYDEETSAIDCKGTNGPESVIIGEEVNYVSVVDKAADTFCCGTNSQSQLYIQSSLTPQAVYGRVKKRQMKISSSKRPDDYQTESLVHSKI